MKMKIFNILIILAVALSLTACTGEDSAGEERMRGEMTGIPSENSPATDANPWNDTVPDVEKRTPEKSETREELERAGDALRRGSEDVRDAARHGKDAVKDALTDGGKPGMGK